MANSNRAGRPSTNLLSPEIILGSAFLELEKSGLESLSMRRIAERLGVKAASLYNHMHGKEEVLWKLADLICSDISFPAADKNWRDRLIELLENYRSRLVSIKDGAKLLAQTPPFGIHRIRLIEEFLQILRDSGLRKSLIVDTAFALNSYVLGFSMDENESRKQFEASNKASDVDQFFSNLPPDEFPALREFSEELALDSADRRFHVGLDLILEGVEKNAEQSKIS